MDQLRLAGVFSMALRVDALRAEGDRKSNPRETDRNMIRFVNRFTPALMAGFAMACTEPPLRPLEVADGKIPVFRGGSPGTIRVDTLMLEYTIGDTTTWGMPITIGLFDNRLIVSDLSGAPHMSIVDLATRQVAGQFGKNGEGPDEFLQPVWFTPHDSIESQVWIHDFGRQDFTLIDLRLPLDSPIIERKLFIPSRSIAFPVITRDTVVATTLGSDNVLFTLNSTAEIVDSTMVDPPYDEKDVPDSRGRYMANAKRLAYHPATHDIVLSYYHASRLDFFDPRGRHRGTVDGPRQNNVSFGYRGDTFGFESDHQSAYMYITATDNYVYALYCGCKAAYSYNAVHVFDWAGTFIRELVLMPGVAAFAVDPEDATLFGVYHEPWPAVGVWTLPQN